MKSRTQALPKRRAAAAAAGNIALWLLQLLTAAVFLAAGYIKLSGDPSAVEDFARLGFGQWFRIFTGGVEFAAAVLLLVPRWVPVGALLLVCTMLGAAAVHVFLVGGSPLPAGVLLLFNLIIFLGRSGHLRPEATTPGRV